MRTARNAGLVLVGLLLACSASPSAPDEPGATAGGAGGQRGVGGATAQGVGGGAVTPPDGAIVLADGAAPRADSAVGQGGASGGAGNAMGEAAPGDDSAARPASLDDARWLPASFDGLTNREINALIMMDSTLFAGTNGGGVFSSTDKGTSWSAVNAGLPTSSSVRSVSCFAAVGTMLFMGSDGIYRSSDKGNSWTEVSNGLVSPTCCPRGPRGLLSLGGYLFSATHGAGVYRTSDLGDHWSAVNTGLPELSAWGGLAAIGDKLFVGTHGDCATGVCVSTDSGASWSKTSPTSTVGCINMMTASGTDLYVGTWGGGVFHSTDDGASWGGGTGGAVYCVAANGGYVFGGTDADGVMASSDKGAHFVSMNTGLGNMKVTSLLVSGSDLYAGTSGAGVQRLVLP